MEVASFVGVTKVYPPDIRALDKVTVSIDAGEIHAFVGENGAGKSTLMKVLNGEIRPDAGTLDVFGKRVTYRSARDAMADGVGMVHQEILLVDQLTVWENVVLGIEPVGRFGLIDRDRARSDVATTIADAGLALDPDARVSALTVGARQKVEIAKLLHRNVKVLILDEPTAVLTPQEIPELFTELRQLRSEGRTVCYISHHLDEVVALADRISVLRDGALVATVAAARTSVSELARLMVERDVVFTSQRTPRAPGAPVLDVRALTASVQGSSTALGPVDLTVHAGEIVGIAGVEGNGQHDLVRAIAGVIPSTSNTLSVDGIDLRPLSILDRRRHLAHVPAERKTEGGALAASLVENAAMTHHRLSSGFSKARGWWFERQRARELANDVRTRFNVASPSVDIALSSLSGGNQQKVVLGRELSMPRALIILDQPTRGVDVGSIEEIHKRILDVREEGRAVLVVSADLDELLRICDRIVVMFRGQLVLDVPVEEASLTRLGVAMLEGRDDRIPV
jgi:general nucleoside transport system ATP-binding protein